MLRGLVIGLVVTCLVARADARPRLTTGQKLVIAGSTLIATAYSTSFSIGVAVTVTPCFDCEGMPPPTDYRPLYGLIPVAGAWIGLGRVAANFPQDRREGFSDAAMAAELMPYLVPATVELVGLTLLVVGVLADRRHR
jgi:hypothetical protein